MEINNLSEQEQGRRQSLQELRNLGIEPYPAAEFPTDAFSTEIKENSRTDEQKLDIRLFETDELANQSEVQYCPNFKQ